MNGNCSLFVYSVEQPVSQCRKWCKKGIHVGRFCTDFVAHSDVIKNYG
jgi:hypothetical protein